MASIYFGTSAINNDIGSYFNTENGRIIPFPENEAPIVRSALATDEKTFATTTAYRFELSDKWAMQPGLNWMGSEYDHSFEWNNNGAVEQSNSPNGSVNFHNLEYFSHFIYKIDSFSTLRVVPEINQIIEDRRFVTDNEWKKNVGIRKIYFCEQLV